MNSSWTDALHGLRRLHEPRVEPGNLLDRAALDELHHEERRAEPAVVVLDTDDARNRDASFMKEDEQLCLGDAIAVGKRRDQGRHPYHQIFAAGRVVDVHEQRLVRPAGGRPAHVHLDDAAAPLGAPSLQAPSQLVRIA